MTAREVFHAETEPYGGRVAYERGEADARSAYENVAAAANYLIASARSLHPALPEIHFDFFFNGSINALAFRANDRYFIGLSSGAFYMLRFVIGRMLSDSRLFTFVGDPKAERSDLRPVSDYAADAQALHAIYQMGAMLTPNDPVRRKYAQMIEHLAISFLIGHELTHIVHGHVDYLEAQVRHGAVSEFVCEQDAEPDQLERQCLEYDADSRAVYALVQSLDAYFKEPTPELNPWRPEADHPFAMFVEAIVALNIVFQLFGDVVFDAGDLSRSVHPPVPLRRVACEMLVCATARAIWGRGVARVAEKWIVPLTREMERSFSVLLGREVDEEGLRTAFGDAGRLHVRKIQDYWQSTICERLEPYAYKGARTSP